MKRGILWMIFWEFFFIFFVLPWAWPPIVLDMWEDKEPKFVRWIINQATGNF